MEIAAEDSYGNNADVSMAVSVAIQPSGTVPEGTVLPALENSPIQVTLNHGIARLPRLTLCSRVGNYIGEYLLVFSAPGVESHSVSLLLAQVGSTFALHPLRGRKENFLFKVVFHSKIRCLACKVPFFENGKIGILKHLKILF